MVPDLKSRLGITGWLLCLQSFVMAADTLFFMTKKEKSPDRVDGELRRVTPEDSPEDGDSEGKPGPIGLPEVCTWIAPLVTILLGIALIPWVFTDENGVYSDIYGVCNTRFDADISGLGVRISIWAQIAMLFVISSLGMFHKRDTGIKEVGGGLILTHVSLAIAIIVQMYKGTLTSVDAALGAAILDAQNIALHIPLLAKETLAARWQVLILIPTHILGLVLLPVLVVKLNRRDFASEDCQCLRVFWWSQLSDCSAFSKDELSVFWIYYSLRWMMWVQSCSHSVYSAEWFHVSEKSGRHEPAKETEVRKSSREAGIMYTKYPATLSFFYTIYTMYALTSMAATEATIKKIHLRPSSGVYSVGQIIALVIAVATIARALWTLLRLFKVDATSSFPDTIFGILWAHERKEDTGEIQSSSENDTTDPDEHEDESWQGRADTQDNENGPQGSASADPSPSQSSDHRRSELSVHSHSESSHPSPGIMTSGEITAQKLLTHSSLATHSGSPNLAPKQRRREVRPDTSTKSIFGFKYRQPFHLDAAKRIYFPTLIQYLKARRERKAREAMRTGSRSNSDHSPAIGQSSPVDGFEKSKPVADGYTTSPLATTAITSDNLVKVPRSGGDRSSSVGSSASIPVDPTLETEASQAMVPSAGVQSHSPLLRRGKDLGDAPVSTAGRPLVLEPTQVDTRRDTRRTPEDEWPAGTRVPEEEPSEPIQRNTSPLFAAEKDVAEPPTSGDDQKSSTTDSSRVSVPITVGLSDFDTADYTPEDRPDQNKRLGKLPATSPSAIVAGQDMAQATSAQPGEESDSLKTRGLRLLSFDNGVVRGLSALYVLRNMMDKLNNGLEGRPHRKPCEVFDLMGGTGTGGLIAILLGRLELGIDECIDAYNDIMRTTFNLLDGMLKPVLVEPNTHSAELYEAVNMVLDQNGLSRTTLLNDGVSRHCRTFVYAFNIDTRRGIVIRGYDSSNDTIPDMPATILEAVLATFACVPIFGATKIGYEKFGTDLQEFTPVGEIHGEAGSIWGPQTDRVRPPVDCLISIGPGAPDLNMFLGGADRKMISDINGYLQKQEQMVHESMRRMAQFYGGDACFRFNVREGLQSIGVDEWNEQEAIRSATDKYLIGSGQDSLVQECIQKMQQSQDMPLPRPGELEKMFEIQRAAARLERIRLLGRLRSTRGW